MSNKKHNGSFSGKGYYIALILCAAAIGISGYMYYQNDGNQDIQLQDPTGNVAVLNPTEDDVQTVATDPGGQLNNPDGDGATEPSVKIMKTGLPLSGETVAQYAMDCLVYNATTRDWRVHDGIDIAAEAGTQVVAAADGTVYTTYEDDTMGMTVVIRHDNGYVTVYASLDENLLVNTGDEVTLGQAIGTVANTALLESAIGDHLHFAVTCNDEPVDPTDFFAMNE